MLKNTGSLISLRKEESLLGDRLMKTFETIYGTFILNDRELRMEDSDKYVEIENPETLDNERLERIYKVIWDDSFDNNSSMDKLGIMAYGLQALFPKSF